MDKKFSLFKKKGMVCTSIGFLGSLILVLYLKHREQQADLTSLHGIRPIPLTNLNGSAKSIGKSLETSSGAPISKRLDGETSSRDPISKTLDGDNDESSGAPNFQNETSSRAAISQRLDRVDDGDKKSSGASDGCNIFDGMWVYDPAAYPLYHAHQCPFLSDGVNCQRNGRPDYDYASWKWEPRGCNIPRFDGKELLKRWKGKRVVIVGDSINRNQWESLACILYSVLPPGRASVDVRRSSHMLFYAKDYRFTVEFFQSPFLVQLREKVIKLNTLHPTANQWRGADIMVFNSAHWWGHKGRLKAWDFFEHRGRLMEDMEVLKAYEIALKTWAKWIDRTVDPAKTTVFFRSFSPVHKRCYNQTKPNFEVPYESYRGGLMDILEKTLRRMKTPVKYLNITHLTRYRQDAHASAYGSRRVKILPKEQQGQPKIHADCSHWCLPGLPDTWNVLMYISTVLATSPQVF